MTETKESVIDVEEVTEEKKPSSPKKKKGRLKLHLFLMVALGTSTWAYWAFSAQGQAIKSQLLHNPWFSQVNPIKQQPITPTTTNISTVVEPSIIKETTSVIDAPDDNEPTPIFETETDTKPEVGQVVEPLPDLQVEGMEDLSLAVQDMAQQMNTMQQTITQMHNQQLALSQQQIRAQLFALLQHASSPQSKLSDMMIAWKSISLLPLISQDKRDTANQGVADLQNLQHNIVLTTEDINLLITTLAEQLQPKDLNEVAEAVDNLIDPYQQTDVFYSWLDWLKQQFTLSKIDKHALDISDDPYADLKQLITDLNQLKLMIQQHQWGNINSLTSLFYRLEQRGLSASFSRGNITQFQQLEQTWRQEAQTWMAQL